MRSQPHTVAWSDRPVETALAETVLTVTAEQSAALILPGLWGADLVNHQLKDAAAVLQVDGAVGSDGSGACPLIMALLSAEIITETPTTQELKSHLRQWAEQAEQTYDRPPLIVLESVELLDSEAAGTLVQLTRQGLVRLVALLRTEAEMPVFLRRMQVAGELVTLAPEMLTDSSVTPVLRSQLGGAVSAETVQRITTLSGGHCVLAGRILQAAQTSHVLHQVGELWMWATDEEPLHHYLAEDTADMLSGLLSVEQELLILIAAAGNIPERWAVKHFGEDVVLSLRRQSILGPDPVHRQGYMDLRMTSEAVSHAVRLTLGRAEITRLWYKVGQHIIPTSGGPASEAALTWWAARSGERLKTEAAEHACTVCISRSWYHPVGNIVAAAEEVTPLLRVTLARAELALGQVDRAADQLHQLIEDLSNGTTGPKHLEAQRQATILARRLQIFHPATAAPIVEGLQAVGTAGRAHHLDRALSLPLEEESGPWVRELAQARLHGNWDEAICAQLWLGTRLGLRQHPDLGRLLLASLLDDLTREGGHPDVEDAATAVLLLIALAHDWRTDLLRVELLAWSHKPGQSPTLAGVADLVAAMVAMQRDTMVTAHSHASSALASFSGRDAYGLEAFASSVVAATASYVSNELAAAAHHTHRTQIQPTAALSMPSLRLLTRGFELIGSGPAGPMVATKLVELAAQARTEGEWAQEQQLLLLAILGQSEDAARQVLSAPWSGRPGRTRMIDLLAQGFLEQNDRTALETAQLLITAGTSFFGLSIIAARWARRTQMQRCVRVETVRTILTMRQQADEHSLLLENFEDLDLDDREHSVVAGLLRGSSTRTIARALNLSPRTVEAVISGLLHRFGCENRVELVSMDLLLPDA